MSLEKFLGFFGVSTLESLVYTGLIYRQTEGGFWQFWYGVDTSDIDAVPGEEFHYKHFKSFTLSTDDIAVAFPNVDLTQFDFTGMDFPTKVLTVFERLGFGLFEPFDDQPMVSFADAFGYEDTTDYTQKPDDKI